MARALPILIAACSLYGAADDEPSPMPSTEDAGSSESSVADVLGDEPFVDAGARCDLSKPFGTPKQVPGINTTEPELNIWLSDDEKTAYVTVIRAAVAVRWDVYATSRATRDDAFGVLVRMVDVDIDTANTEDLTLTPEGLLAAFSSSRPPADGGTSDLFIATRSVATAPFDNITPIANINDPAEDQNPFLTADGLELFFNSMRNGDWELFHSLRGAGGSFGAPISLGLGLATSNATLTRDGLTLYFSHHESDGSSDIWTATRATTASPFTNARGVDELNVPAKRDVPGWVSPDGCRIYFMSARDEGPGGYDQWFADKPP